MEELSSRNRCGKRRDTDQLMRSVLRLPVNEKKGANTLIHYLAIKARIMGSFASLEPTQTLFGDYGNLRFVV
jgi:hypothetical protein